MQERLLLGLAVLFGIFLLWKRKTPSKSLRTPPINQNLGPIKRASLIPYIEAQARHETGNYSSRLAQDQFNLFGMKKPFIRPFVGSKNSSNEYMTYESYDQSVKDLLLWMDNTGFPVSVRGSSEYVAELKKRGYFTDNYFTYLNGINSALESLQKSGVSGFKITWL
jgi:flagellum-specific peptidoglycan hydrolase FlgJ